MVQVADAQFIVIDGEVAMSEETVCKILGVPSDKLHELSRQAKSSKGIHLRGGQIYFSTVDAIFSVRDANGKKSADLSTVELTRMFETAEDRLLPREIVKAKRKRTYIKMGVFGLIVVGFFVYAVNSEPTPKPAPALPPKIETPVEKPKPKVEVPAESFYAEAYDGIAKLTGMRVTERWMLEFGEHIAANGNVDVRGQVELNNDGVKRPFWMLFDGTTRQILRLKIGPDLIYSATGW